MTAVEMGRKKDPAKDKLVMFLYILMREHLPSGRVERIMEEHVDEIHHIPIYENGYLAEHAANIAGRLREKSDGKDDRQEESH